MTLLKKQILGFTNNIAIVWHPCPLSNFLKSIPDLTVIQKEEVFLKTDFNKFNTVLILAELSWCGNYHNRMSGIHVFREILNSVYLPKTRIQLISFYSNSFFERNFPISYPQSILLDKEINSPFGILNVWNLFDLRKREGEKLLKFLFQGNNHDTHIGDLIVRTVVELEQSKEKLKNSTLKITKSSLVGKMFSKLNQIKQNYECFLQLRENLFFRKVNESFRLHSAINVIDKLNDAIEHKLTHKRINDIIEYLELLKKHFEEIQHFLSQIESHGKKSTPAHHLCCF